MTKRLWTEGRQKQATDFIQNLSQAEQSCVKHGAVNQPFIVYKKKGVISEGECSSQLVN